MKRLIQQVFQTLFLLLIAASLITLLIMAWKDILADAPKEPEPTVQAVVLEPETCLICIPSVDLRDTLSAGDVVSICNANGAIPALKYAKVAQVTDEAVGILLSEEQVNAYLAATGKITLVLRAKANDESAEKLLQWQTSYNNPTVRLSFEEKEVSLAVGQSLAAPVALTVTPVEATPEALVWSSSAPEIVTVDADGIISGVAVGEAEITVTALDKTAAIRVVVSVPAAEVQLSQSSVTLAIGGTVALTATVEPEDVTDNTVVWNSDHEDVATVNVDGTVTALQEGTTVITATCGEATAQCSITVYTPASGITLSKSKVALKEGGTEQLTATISPDAASGRPVLWKSSDPAIATVTEDGTIKAIKAGTVTITATCDSVTATCTVTIS